MDAQSQKFETVKTFAKLVSDDAKSVLLYGSVAVGLLVFSLPQLLDFCIPFLCYWISLFAGSVGLLSGAAIFFWYSRRLTMANHKCGDLLLKMTKDSNVEFDKEIDKIRIFKKDSVRFRVGLAKYSGGLGALFYFVAIIIFLFIKLGLIEK